MGMVMDTIHGGNGMFSLLAMALVVYIWLRSDVGFFTKVFLTCFICSGGCGLAVCTGVM